MYFNTNTININNDLVPHPKHCSVELLFLPKMKLVENVIGEAFPGLSDSCGICFYVENTGFLVSGSKARRMKNTLK